jgi:hypothetical protein
MGDLGLTLLGGTVNPLDVDEREGELAPWYNEPILGARLEYGFLEKLLVGTHAVMVSHERNWQNEATFGSLGSWHDAIWGVGVEATDLFEMLTLAGELDLQHTESETGNVIRGPGGEGDDFRGLAAYASVTLTVGELNALAEYKYYDDFNLRNALTGGPYDIVYHQPPTLERITAEIKDNSKISGARVRLDYNLGQLGPVELSVFVNMGYFEDWHEDDDRILNPFAGFELQWMDGLGHAEGSSGLRRVESRNGDALACIDPRNPGGRLAAPCLHFQDAHAELNVEQGFLDNHGIKLAFELLDRIRRENTDDHWIELHAALTYKWSPHLAVSFVYEYQGDPQFEIIQRSAHYLLGSVRYFIDPSSYIEARVGESKPGLKCINGVCRNYPPFAGATLVGVMRF